MDPQLFLTFAVMSFVLCISPGPIAPQLAIMCVLPVVIALMTDSGWAVAAGWGRGWFMKPSRAKSLARLSGSMLIGGGVWLSLTRRPA